jgi:signal transduction histidine kinase
LTATISLPLIRKDLWYVALVVISVISISAYLIQSFGFFLYSKFPNLAILNLIGTTLFTIFIPMILVYFIPGHKPAISNQIAFSISVILITSLGHLAQAGLLRQEELLEIETAALQKATAANAEINFELARITKDWAQHIHGNVQSRLHAYALVLEQAQLRGDAEGVERAIEEISRTIKDLDQEQTILEISSLEEEVMTTCALWDGIVEIEIQVQDEIRTLRKPIVANIKKCLVEAITNSVRHGHADAMRVSVIKIGELAKLVIEDNGIGFTEINQGFGSKTFEALTSNSWNLVRNTSTNHTILELNFNLAVPRVGVEPTLGGF